MERYAWKATVLPSHEGSPVPGTTILSRDSTAIVRKRMSRHSLLAAYDTISMAISFLFIAPSPSVCTWIPERLHRPRTGRRCSS